MHTCGHSKHTYLAGTDIIVAIMVEELLLFCLFSWTQINVTQSRLSQSTEDSFSKMSFEAEGSYGGLVSVSGGYSNEEGSSSLAVSGSNLKISFKIRKVTIQRPWMDPAILHYPIVGIKGLPSGAWSSGELDGKTNKGSFPLLPTAMIVAKDVVISSDKFSESLKQSFSETSAHASVKVSKTKSNTLTFGHNYYFVSSGGHWSI